jgi:ATP-binding cassette subfamily F protein uup
MDTLDLLEDMLADYAGTLILVSHDRDFIDRLATSTIALDGRGHAVETPGGWKDFLSQNPSFLEPPEAGPVRRPKSAAPPRPAAPTAKLSFKDQRRLAELEARLAALPGEIAAMEHRLHDPGLYARDPAAFARTSAALEAARDALAAAEEAWLELETLKESLARGAG